MKSFFVAIAVLLFFAQDIPYMAGPPESGFGPVIKLASPVDGDRIWIGERSGMHFVLKLTDDKELDNYRVEIRKKMPDRMPERDQSPTGNPFSFNKSWDISGKSEVSIHHHEIVIAEGAEPGVYEFMVYCTNKAGITSKHYVNIELAVFDLR